MARIPVRWWVVALAVVLLAGGARWIMVGSQPSGESGPGPSSGASSSRGSALLDCAAQPVRCGFPDSGTTGPTAGVALTAVPGQATEGQGWTWDARGFVHITDSGTRFAGYAVTGTIDVDAVDNVVIQDVTVNQGGETFGIALRHSHSTTVENVAITAPDAGPNRLLVGVKDIYGDATGTIIRRCDVSRTSTGIQIHEGLIEDSYVHDLGYREGDHVNGTTTNGGTGVLTIRHNTVLNRYDQTDAVSLFQDFGPRANVTIENNLVAGGAYAIYAGANPGQEATATNIRVLGNRFSTIYFPQSGRFGPYTAYTPGGGNEFSGNVWDATGLPVA